MTAQLRRIALGVWTSLFQIGGVDPVVYQQYFTWDDLRAWR